MSTGFDLEATATSFSLRPLLSAVSLFVLAGCSCIHIPKQCCKPADPNGEKKTLLYGDEATGTRAAFKTVWMEGGGRRWKVFVIGNPSNPPILLLHEIPALSPGALKLAQRLSHKFHVYVPLLFGGELDNNNSGFLRTWRPIEMSLFRPSWNALGSGERKITHQLSGLCQTIVKEHGEKTTHLGVIGMCITGALPLQLLAEKEPIPQIRATVISQPTMPVLTCTAAQRQSLGISDEELQRAKAHVEAANLQILGFRFELDAVSPKERSTRLKDEFQSHFRDCTIPKEDYIYADHMPPEAHAVLTDGYCPPKKDPLRPAEPAPPPPSAGQRAYAQLLDYLDRTLRPKG